jgi:hypothetical protein
MFYFENRRQIDTFHAAEVFPTRFPLKKKKSVARWWWSAAIVTVMKNSSVPTINLLPSTAMVFVTSHDPHGLLTLLEQTSRKLMIKCTALAHKPWTNGGGK